MEDIPMQYIGDGVYAEFDGYNIIVSLGKGTPNIYLNPNTWKNLKTYAETYL